MHRILVPLAVALALSACHDKETPVVDGGSSRPDFVLPGPEISVAMGYAVEAPLAILGGSSRAFVVAKVDQVPADLEVGFVGPGSIDDPLDLAASEKVDLKLAVTGVDATKRAYVLHVSLYTQPAVDSAETEQVKVASTIVSLTLVEPRFDVTVTPVSTDPATLAQTFRLQNYGDAIDSVDVRVGGVLGTLSSLRPEMTHVSLEKGEAVQFDVVPILYPGMGKMTGQLTVEAGTHVKSVPLTVAPPAGKQVYVGFGSSWFDSSDSGEHCTNQSPLKKPLGKAPRKPTPSGEPDFWSKAYIGGLYEKGTSDGMAVGKALVKATGAKYLNVPMMMLGQVFKSISAKLKADPPDANFKVVARPVFRTPTVVAPDAATGLTAEGAAALNLLVANGYLLADLGNAAAATLDKLGGAKAANDAEWMDRQEAVLRAYSQMLVGLAQNHAVLFEGFIAVAPEAIAAGTNPDDVRAMQADLSAHGFTADEQADFAKLGLTQADQDEVKAAILAVDADVVGVMGWPELIAQYWSGDEVAVPDLARVFELSAMARTNTRLPKAQMLVRFELPTPRCAIGPHTTVLRFNDDAVLTLANTVPEGLYSATVDPAKVLFYGALPSGNTIGIDTLDLNTGNFVRALDATLMVEMPLHGELVVAADQVEADTLVGGLGTTNHSQPDLVLTTNDVPYLDRTKITAATLVTLPIKVLNLGHADSVATKLGVYVEDPRLGDPGAPLQTEVDVPAIVAGASATVNVPLLGARLLDENETRHYLWVRQANDFRPLNNIVALTNEAGCTP